ncbi:glycosyltransferase [Yeosuana marina]|uniref:glycosyltransferase n=1 Tax=Yeosuana marina TaxID=1565536 RepID=UPI0030C7FAC0
MKKVLSIILPVYNVEDYLEKCLRSIFMNEIFQYTLEIIAVNDGSTDSSPIILQRLKNEIPNLIIIHQLNQGLSVARNTGLNSAKGDYIWFIDSDDFINNLPVNYNEMLDYKYDMVYFNFNIVVEKENKEAKLKELFNYRSHFREGEYRNIEFYKLFFNRPGTMYAWSYFIKREFIETNKLRFLPKIYFEDIEFTTRAIFLSNKILYKNVTLYNYLQRKGSILASLKTKYFYNDHIEIIKSLIYFYKNRLTKIDDLFITEIRKEFLRIFLDLSYYENKDILNASKSIRQLNVEFYESYKWKVIILFMKNNVKTSVSIIKITRKIIVYFK